MAHKFKVESQQKTVITCENTSRFAMNTSLDTEIRPSPRQMGNQISKKTVTILISECFTVQHSPPRSQAARALTRVCSQETGSGQSAVSYVLTGRIFPIFGT